MRFLKVLFPVGLACILAGCASYRLGSVNGTVAGEKSVEILPFNNQTLQTRFGDAVTQALRERLQVDATYHLATSAPGDLVISGVIGRYQREGLGYLNTDSATPQNFRVEVTAHVIIRERVSGKLLLDRDVKAHSLVNVGPDFASAERQAAPLIAADLAQNILELLTEGAW
jgi:hypothetical protein